VYTADGQTANGGTDGDTDGDTDDDMFEVDCLVDERRVDPPNRNGAPHREFKVHWHGYGETEDTWLPLSSLGGCVTHLREFEAAREYTIWSRKTEPYRWGGLKPGHQVQVYNGRGHELWDSVEIISVRKSVPTMFVREGKPLHFVVRSLSHSQDYGRDEYHVNRKHWLRGPYACPGHKGKAEEDCLGCRGTVPSVHVHAVADGSDEDPVPEDDDPQPVRTLVVTGDALAVLAMAAFSVMFGTMNTKAQMCMLNCVDVELARRVGRTCRAARATWLSEHCSMYFDGTEQIIGGRGSGSGIFVRFPTIAHYRSYCAEIKQKVDDFPRDGDGELDRTVPWRLSACIHVSVGDGDDSVPTRVDRQFFSRWAVTKQLVECAEAVTLSDGCEHDWPEDEDDLHEPQEQPEYQQHFEELFPKAPDGQHYIGLSPAQAHARVRAAELASQLPRV
jgi:hypothetical protein